MEATPASCRAMTERLSALLDKQIFFAGGMWKSGTTWFQTLLDRHPQISCGGEAHFLVSLKPALEHALEEHNQRTLGRQAIQFRNERRDLHPRLATPDLDYLLATAILCALGNQMGDRQVRAIGERSTENIRSFDVFARLFPEAKFLQIVRDPRDAGVSLWFQSLRQPAPEPPAQRLPISDLVKNYAETWSASVAQGVAFGTRHPAAYLELRYEDLVAEPVPTFARVCRFLGVDDDEPILRRCLEEASFERLSGGRARGQENRDSFFRKGVAGDWRNHLDAAAEALVIEKAGGMMRRFGYL
jgi:sulfotransferase family protein